MNYLVSYTKGEDIQYHYFTEVPEPLEFIFDEIQRKFTKKGYTWSAIEFPKELADLCMFTQSKYEKGKI